MIQRALQIIGDGRDIIKYDINQNKYLIHIKETVDGEIMLSYEAPELYNYIVEVANIVTVHIEPDNAGCVIRYEHEGDYSDDVTMYQYDKRGNLFSMINNVSSDYAWVYTLDLDNYRKSGSTHDIKIEYMYDNNKNIIMIVCTGKYDYKCAYSYDNNHVETFVDDRGFCYSRKYDENLKKYVIDDSTIKLPIGRRKNDTTSI